MYLFLQEATKITRKFELMSTAYNEFSYYEHPAKRVNYFIRKEYLELIDIHIQKVRLKQVLLFYEHIFRN